MGKETAGEKKKNVLSVRDKDSGFKKHFRQGLTILIVVLVSIGFYFLLLRAGTLSEYIWKVVGVMRPIIYGVVIAYLLNPIVNVIERLIINGFKDKVKKEATLQKIARSIGVFAAVLLGISIVVALGLMLLPELFKSIRDLVYTLPRQVNDFVDWVVSMQNGDSQSSKIITELLEGGAEYLEKWLRTDLLSQINVMMSSITVGVFNFLKSVFHFLIGIIVSVYILFSKESFAAYAKKTNYAVLGVKKGNFLLHVARKSHQIFGGFISGKILDSAIIGVLCFISLTILKMPYSLLVSVIIGVTNVIPFFGPYIGAIPSAILIALVNPIQGLYFLIFILILQQVDGNIIGPKILGDSTGLSPFWIIVAILVGGGLFGFVGMVMGVPTLAVVFYIISLFMDRKLEERKLPTDTEIYEELDFIEIKTKKVQMQKKDEKTAEAEKDTE